jgi:hypothetical protein
MLIANIAFLYFYPALHLTISQQTFQPFLLGGLRPASAPNINQRNIY